ncbi:MAG: hypothetical protein NVSMB52_18080 [Chloroflexota bacterium]
MDTFDLNVTLRRVVSHHVSAPGYNGPKLQCKGRGTSKGRALSNDSQGTVSLETSKLQPDGDERERIIALVADVSRSLVRGGPAAHTLQICVESMVRHLDAAFARIWTLNEADNVLEMQASAGMYTHLDGAHGRVPVGDLKIGLIAQERLPHLTNQVIGDPRVTEQEWAKREGMVAFAGFPLLVDDRLVGVAAMFSRYVISERTLYALAAISDSIALGIERARAQEELQASLERESSARRIAEVESERASILARELTRIQAQKDEFLSAAAHDLKNPLAGIQGVAQLLLRRMHRTSEIDPVSLQKSLEQITGSSKRMTGLINQLMDLAHLQSGQPLELNCRETDLVSLVTRVVTEQQMLSEEHHISIHAAQPQILGSWDADRMDRVLSNLVSNAVKYSPSGGKVVVDVHHLEDTSTSWAEIDVQDEGIGVPPGDVPRIFDRFFRATNVPAGIHGTGIGLAAARHIVEQHGGTINCVSNPLKGSTFIVRLPVSPR